MTVEFLKERIEKAVPNYKAMYNAMYSVFTTMQDEVGVEVACKAMNKLGVDLCNIHHYDKKLEGEYVKMCCELVQPQDIEDVLTEMYKYDIRMPDRWWDIFMDISERYGESVADDAQAEVGIAIEDKHNITINQMREFLHSCARFIKEL